MFSLDTIEAVCFDAFGTLVRIDDNRAPYRKLLQNHTFADISELRHLIMCQDISFCDVMDLILPNCAEEHKSSLIADLESELASIKLRPNIQKIWSDLRSSSFKISVCSNLAQPYGAPLLRCLPDQVNAVIFSYQIGYMKPDHEIYAQVCKQLNLEKEKILFVGDSPKADVIGPRNYGMHSMLVSEFEKYWESLPHSR